VLCGSGSVIPDIAVFVSTYKLRYCKHENIPRESVEGGGTSVADLPTVPSLRSVITLALGALRDLSTSEMDG